MHLNKHINETFSKLNKGSMLNSVSYKDHISCIFHNHIVRIYQDKVYLVYALEDIEYEIVKPVEIDYINSVIQDDGV